MGVPCMVCEFRAVFRIGGRKHPVGFLCRDRRGMIPVILFITQLAQIVIQCVVDGKIGAVNQRPALFVQGEIVTAVGDFPRHEDQFARLRFDLGGFFDRQRGPGELPQPAAPVVNAAFDHERSIFRHHQRRQLPAVRKIDSSADFVIFRRYGKVFDGKEGSRFMV